MVEINNDLRVKTPFIKLEIKPSNGNSSFVALTQSDGGMTIHKTQVKNDPDTLMFETDEGWSRLVD